MVWHFELDPANYSSAKKTHFFENLNDAVFYYMQKYHLKFIWRSFDTPPPPPPPEAHLFYRAGDTVTKENQKIRILIFSKFHPNNNLFIHVS